MTVSDVHKAHGILLATLDEFVSTDGDSLLAYQIATQELSRLYQLALRAADKPKRKSNIPPHLLLK